jgi:NhaP-type Na+/H+ or K+/H+ antiporter
MPDKFDSLVDFINSFGGGVLSTIAASVIGRAMWHFSEARKGNRPLFGVDALWEVPAIFGMILMGEAIGSYFGLSQSVTAGVTATLSWFGPRGLEALFMRWFGKKYD